MIKTWPRTAVLGDGRALTSQDLTPSLSVFGAVLLSRLWAPPLLPSIEVIHSWSCPGPKAMRFWWSVSILNTAGFRNPWEACLWAYLWACFQVRWTEGPSPTLHTVTQQRKSDEHQESPLCFCSVEMWGGKESQPHAIMGPLASILSCPTGAKVKLPPLKLSVRCSVREVRNVANTEAGWPKAVSAISLSPPQCHHFLSLFKERKLSQRPGRRLSG